MRLIPFVLTGVAAFTMVNGSAMAASYAIDPAHTHATFEVVHFGTSTNRGRMGKTEGSVQFDRTAGTGSVQVTLDLASLNTGTAAFDKHLQSPDFFNVEKFPTASFSGDKLTFNGDKVVEVAGALTMLGKTNPVTLKVNQFNCYMHPKLKREICGGDFETSVDRTQWGMDWGTAYGIPKNVRVVIQVEAVAQQ